MSALSLNDLLRLATPEPVVWLSTGVHAGHAATQVGVRWVALRMDEAQPGDLLLLPGAALSSDLLHEAKSRGLAAVLVVGETSLPEQAMPDDLCVAHLPNGQDIHETQRQLLTMLVNQRATLLERGVQIHAQLSQIEAEGVGLSGLVEAMAVITGHGLVVQDKRLQVLASQSPEGAPSGQGGAGWEETLVALTQLENLPEALRDRKQAGLKAVILTQELGDGLARLVTPINVGGITRGYLSLLCQGEAFDLLDHLVTEQGALVCAVEMARNKAIRETEKRLKGDLLSALLQENLTPRDAQLWTQGMGLNLEQVHVALRFAWSGAEQPSRRRLETLINGETARLDLRVIISPMGGEVVCFCEVARATKRPETALALAQAVIDQGGREYPDMPVRCGVGNPVNNLHEWRASFRQAGQALELARRFKEHKPLYFPDLSVYRLLLQIEHDPELMAFQEEILGPLLAHESGRDLIRTLEVYFKHNGNLSQTAEAMFIHRNTLLYRIERIAEIAGISLESHETRLALQLALQIYRMTETREDKRTAISL